MSQSSTPTPGVQNQSTRVVKLSTTIDTLTNEVLMNMHLHSWNPHAMSHRIITGGLFINWKMSDPSITNAKQLGSIGVHEHDPQVDLWYLAALAQYSQIHPADHTYDGDLSHTTTLVLADFRSYDLPKIWIYFYLLKAGLLTHNSDLVNEAHTIASNF